MFTKNKKFKKIIIGGVMALSVFSTSFLTANIQKQNFFDGVNASYQQVLSSITNNDFSSVGTSSTPYTPNSWTYKNPLNNESIKNGVINTFDNVFQDKKKDYELEVNPQHPLGDIVNGENDPLYKHLMINSASGFSRAGYASTSFTLSSNSFYSIDVTLKTTDTAKASVYLSGLKNSEVNASISSITTFDTWETYTLLIETNEFVTESVQLELWLGGNEEGNIAKGAALFNKVTLKQYSKTIFNSIVNDRNNATSKIVSLKNNYFIDNAISNPTFALNSGDSNAITGWKLLESAGDSSIQSFKIVDTDSYNASADTEIGIKNPETNQMSDDTKVLYVNNKQNSKFGIESTSFNLPQSELYLLTVWTKSDCNTGSGANLKLVEVNPDENNEDFVATTATITCATSVTSNAPISGWTMNTFFIEGHPLKDTNIKLQIWLGETEDTTGYVFVDDITLEKVNYEVYQNASDSGTTKYTYNANNTSYTVSNGNFNDTQKPEIELSYPLTPNKWTLTSNDTSFDVSESLSGVINTNDAKFEILKNYLKTKNINIANPGLTPVQQISGATTANSSNNILMLGNPVKTSQTYKSDAFSLASGSYYKLSYLVNTQYANPINDNGNYGIGVKLTGSMYTMFNRNNISTNGNWTKYEVYIHTGNNENSACNLEFALNNIQGFAFIDDVKLETSTEEKFKVSESATINKVDMSSENFGLVESNSDSAFKSIYNWAGKDNSETGDVQFGVIDSTKDLSYALPGITNPGSVNGKNILMIQSSLDTYFTATQTDTFSLNLEEYYKISVSVKTIGINQIDKNHTYDKDNKLIDYGVTIEIKGFENKFTAINTEKDNQDGYVTYTFYVTPDTAATTQLQLSLGNENNLASGYAFFDNVKFETIDETIYRQAQIENEKNNKVLILNKISTEDTDTDNGSDFKGSEFDWVIVPSLLLALSIIIALVGTAVRQFKFTKKPKIKTSYDRRKTIEVDMDKREQIELRNRIIEELNKEYDEINSEINDLNNLFEQEMQNIVANQEEKRNEHNKVKQAILLEKENAIKEYNEKISSTENLSNEDKAKFEKQFNEIISKLDKKSIKEDTIAAKKDKSFEELKAKHEAKVKQLTAKQQFIKDEIERIEREIESIAKQEEIMWNEYRRAKEEARKQKLEYMAEKRNTKQNAKTNKTTDSVENEELNIQKEENKTEKVENAEANVSENEIEVIEPDSDDKK